MWRRCKTDDIGIANALKEDKKLTKTTSLFEILDNSNKAMKNNENRKKYKHSFFMLITNNIIIF